MSETRNVDDLTPDEVRDIDEFYADDKGKKTLPFDEFMKELKEES